MSAQKRHSVLVFVRFTILIFYDFMHLLPLNKTIYCFSLLERKEEEQDKKCSIVLLSELRLKVRPKRIRKIFIFLVWRDEWKKSSLSSNGSRQNRDKTSIASVRSSSLLSVSSDKCAKLFFRDLFSFSLILWIKIDCRIKVEIFELKTDRWTHFGYFLQENRNKA